MGELECKRVQEARQAVTQAFCCASKRQLTPWNRRRLEHGDLQSLFIDAQRATKGRGGVDDDHGRTARVGIDVDESVQSDVEPTFLTRFTDRRDRQRFTPIDVATREHPAAVSGIDGASDEHDLT